MNARSQTLIRRLHVELGPTLLEVSRPVLLVHLEASALLPLVLQLYVQPELFQAVVLQPVRLVMLVSPLDLEQLLVLTALLDNLLLLEDSVRTALLDSHQLLEDFAQIALMASHQPLEDSV